MRPYRYINILSILVVLACLLIFHIAWLALLIIILLVMLPLVLGAIYIQWNFYIKSFNKGSKPQQVALTFDDGPNEGTAAILDILAAQNVKATFFAIGKNIAANPVLVKRWHSEGHTVANHSYHHGFNFDWKSRDEMAKEITDTNAAIKHAIGKKPLLFRPPYGVTNPNLAKAVTQTNMHSIGWNIRSFDTKAKDPQQLLQRILDRIKGGDIILLHDKPDITHEILTELIIRIREKGYTFATVDELLDIKAYA